MVEVELSTLALRRKALGDDLATPENIKGNLTALCLSGGGVRSASFCLGLMRAFAANNGGLLKRFDYLSTVSGGGFAGSFVTRLVASLSANPKDGGYAAAEKVLANKDALESKTRGTGLPPLAYLKENISYLAPRMGITSLDNLAGAGLALRNLLLNWLILVPCLLAIVCAILAFYELACIAAYSPSSAKADFLRLLLPVVGLTLAGWAFAESLAVRPGWTTREQSGERNREESKTSEFFLLKGIPQSVAALCLAFSVLLSEKSWAEVPVWQVMALGGMMTGFAFLQAVYGHVALRAGDNKKPSVLLVLWMFAVVAQGVVASAVAFSLGRLLLNLLPSTPLIRSQLLVSFAPLLMATGMFIGETIYVALTSWTKDGEEEREWLARNSAAQFILPLVWLALSLPVAVAPDFVNKETAAKLGFNRDAMGGSVTLITTIAGFIVVQLGRAKELWSLAKQNTESLRTWSKRQLLALALPVFIFGLAVLLSSFAHSIVSASALVQDPKGIAATWSLVALAPTIWVWGSIVVLLAGYGFLAHRVEEKAGPANSLFSYRHLSLMVQLLAGFVLLCMVLSKVGPKVLEFSQGQAAAKFALYAALVILFAFCAALADYLIETNRFSLHAIYRNRIIRTFLGAGNVVVADGKVVTAGARTGLVTNLNIPLGDIGNLLLAGMKPGETKMPADASHETILPQIHVLGFSMNVPASKSLAVQERKALPFTASPLFVGSRSIEAKLNTNRGPGCYRNSADYAKYPAQGWLSKFNNFLLDRQNNSSSEAGRNVHEMHAQRALSLGTAAAISGAAVNSNMGYHSSPTLSVLLTAFNVRLGVWLGNTNESGEDAHRLDGPVSSLKCLFLEAFDLANEKRPFVHLSDGGHFDNLAAYEMIARKCRLVVVVDAGADPTPDFADLGVLSRLVYLDFGCRINFKPADMDKMLERKSAIMEGEIDYGPDYPEGRIVYIKPAALPEFLTPSARAYVLANKQFPHEPTVDQWFSESQFTAYFQLGEQIGRQVARKYLTGAFRNA